MKKILLLTATGILSFLLTGCTPFYSGSLKQPKPSPQEAENKKIEALLSSIYNEIQNNLSPSFEKKIYLELEKIVNNPLAYPKYKCIALDYQLYLAVRKKNFQIAAKKAKEADAICPTSIILLYPKFQQTIQTLEEANIPTICLFHNISKETLQACKNWASQAVIKYCSGNNTSLCQCFNSKSVQDVASCVLQTNIEPDLIPPTL